MLKKQIFHWIRLKLQVRIAGLLFGGTHVESPDRKQNMKNHRNNKRKEKLSKRKDRLEKKEKQNKKKVKNMTMKKNVMKMTPIQISLAIMDSLPQP